MRSCANAILPEAVTCGRQHRASPRPERQNRHRDATWFPGFHPTRGEVRGPFPRGSEQGQRGRWVLGGAFLRRGPNAPGCSAVGGGRRHRVPCATAQGVSRASCGLEHAGRRRRVALDPQDLSLQSPRLRHRSRGAGRRAGGLGEAGPGAPHARREGRRLPGGARMVGGARAHAPCARAILE